MNPNKAFRFRKKNRPQNSFHVWRCTNCGWKRDITGGVVDGYRKLQEDPVCPSCRRTQANWQRISGGFG